MTATINASTSSGVVITPDNSGAIALQNAGTTGLTLDASGRPLTPLRPAFRARLESTYSTADGSIPFNSSAGSGFNTASCWSNSTYRFTAPVDGTYMFSLAGFTGSSADAYVWIRVNGSAVTELIAYTSNNYRILSSTVVLYLTASQYVDVQLKQGSIYGSSTYGGSTFQGFLIG